MRATLYIAGAVFELGGIMLLAAPDLVPGAIRAAGWSRRRARALANVGRRLFRKPPRGVVHTAGVSGGIALGGHASAVIGTGATTLEDKVEYLLRRDQDAQKMFNDLARRVTDIESVFARRLDSVREELKAHVADELAATQADYKTARLTGTAALAIGLALTTLGNFA